MSECFLSRFILNGESRDTSHFDIDLVFRGESLYEVFRIIRGIPLFIEDHLDRLFRTSGIAGLEIWYSRNKILEMIRELLRINRVGEGNIKLVFNYTGNSAGQTRNFLAYFMEHLYPSPAQYREGVNGILFHGTRKNPTAKIINQHLRLAVYKQLIEKSAYEALLVDKEGFITEGSRSNIFLIEGETIHTAPDEDVLSGITRKHVLKACNDHGIRIVMRKVHHTRLNRVEAVFLTGTSPRVLPFCRIGQIEFNPQNPLLRTIMTGFDDLISQYINSRLPG